jgi:hypothetical protein
MIKELLYKWFGLDSSCPICNVLRAQLEYAQAEKRELLLEFLNKDRTPEVPLGKPQLNPIKPSYVPWRVRQQMLEAEDREKAKILRSKNEELEKELEIAVK